MKLSQSQEYQLKSILAHGICGLGDESQAFKAYEFTTLADRELIAVIIEKIKKI